MKTSNSTTNSLLGRSETHAGDVASIPETSGGATPSRLARMSGGTPEQQQESREAPDEDAIATPISGGAQGQQEQPQAAPAQEDEESIDTPDLQVLSDRHFTSFEHFNRFVSTLTNIHPYVLTALGILTPASELLLTQASLDEAVSDLLNTVQGVYEFVREQNSISSLDHKTLVMLLRAINESIQFITNYSETKSFWKRTGKHIFSETRAIVDRHKETIDILMQRCRDRVTWKTQVNTYRLMEDRKLEGMTCADGAGLNTMKKCFDGTRMDILREILNWFTDPNVTAPRILWLRGQAGSGKSTIAHTIASRMKDVGRLGSCFCFSRDQQAENHEKKILRTIARDLADRDQSFRRALVDVVSEDPSLKTTSDVMQQWQKLILKPLSEVGGVIVGNVVIDALDESGSDTSREHILSLLTSPEAAGLPSNFRILLTSRPLPDIERALGATAHVKTISLDGVPEEHDIGLYVELCCHPEIGATEIQSIGQKSNRLFE